MWYFTWILGVGFAVLLAILNAMWGENEDARKAVVAKGCGETQWPSRKTIGRLIPERIKPSLHPAWQSCRWALQSP